MAEFRITSCGPGPAGPRGAPCPELLVWRRPDLQVPGLLALPTHPQLTLLHSRWSADSWWFSTMFRMKEGWGWGGWGNCRVVFALAPTDVQAYPPGVADDLVGFCVMSKYGKQTPGLLTSLSWSPSLPPAPHPAPIIHCILWEWKLGNKESTGLFFYPPSISICPLECILILSPTFFILIWHFSE